MENLLIGETDDQAITWGVVLALVLGHQATTGLVISLSLAAATPLSLVALAIGLVLGKLDAGHSAGVGEGMKKSTMGAS